MILHYAQLQSSVDYARARLLHRAASERLANQTG